MITANLTKFIQYPLLMLQSSSLISPINLFQILSLRLRAHFCFRGNHELESTNHFALCKFLPPVTFNVSQCALRFFELRLLT